MMYRPGAPAASVERAREAWGHMTHLEVSRWLAARRNLPRAQRSRFGHRQSSPRMANGSSTTLLRPAQTGSEKREMTAFAITIDWTKRTARSRVVY